MDLTQKENVPIQEDQLEEGLPIEEGLPMKEDLPINKDFRIEGDLLLQEDQSIQQDLPIRGDLPFHEDLPIKEDLSIQEDLPIQEDLSVQEDQSIQQNLPVMQNMPIRQKVPIKQLVSLVDETSSNALPNRKAAKRRIKRALLSKFQMQKIRYGWTPTGCTLESPESVTTAISLRDLFEHKVIGKLDFTENEMQFLEDVARRVKMAKERQKFMTNTRTVKRKPDWFHQEEESKRIKASCSPTSLPLATEMKPTSTAVFRSGKTSTRKSTFEVPASTSSATNPWAQTSPTSPTSRGLPTSPASTSNFNFSSPPKFVVSDSVSEDDVKMENEQEETFEMPPMNHLDDEFKIAAENVTNSTRPWDTDAYERRNELSPSDHFIQNMKTAFLQNPALLSHFIRDSPQLASQLLDFGN